LGTQFGNSFIQQSGFVHGKIQANNDGSLTVVYNNQIVYTNFPGAFPPTQGVFGLGARTGGANENCWIDNLQITTITNLPAHPYLSSASPGPNSTRISPTPTITLNLTDTATQVNPASILLSLNNANVTPLNITKNGSVTTITYTPGGLFASGSTNTIKLSYADNGTPVYSNSITYTFVVTTYATLDPSFALSPADATAAKANPGFYVQLVQPGLYPFRVTYEEGGGGYAVHLFSRNPDRTKSVLNDSLIRMQ